MPRRKRTRPERKPEQTGCIKFSVDRTGDTFAFKAGETYTLPLSSCDRWVRRGVAQYVTAPKENAAKVPDFETATIKHKAETPTPPDVEPVTEEQKPKGSTRGKSSKNH